jgi:hypothetical protein
MSVRRGENARLEAAGWTITVTSPRQPLLSALAHWRWPW